MKTANKKNLYTFICFNPINLPYESKLRIKMKRLGLYAYSYQTPSLSNNDGHITYKIFNADNITKSTKKEIYRECIFECTTRYSKRSLPSAIQEQKCFEKMIEFVNTYEEKILKNTIQSLYENEKELKLC